MKDLAQYGVTQQASEHFSLLQDSCSQLLFPTTGCQGSNGTECSCVTVILLGWSLCFLHSKPTQAPTPRMLNSTSSDESSRLFALY